MAGKKLHPSVEQFKAFVKEHPILIKLVRDNEYTWQELYEDWYLLGEDDPKWAQYTNGNTSKAGHQKDDNKTWVQQLTGVVKKMDANQMQHHINNLSQAIGAIQGVLTQFQGNNQENTQPQNDAPRNPFSFRKD
ncbi:YlbD family protein [Bacillus norwichensis]|uniref:YlbD family protein n=1 Tax=Bacillus norwichensis TaxID=2762217 RepID=A0ABR8VQH0_9BACI|nr:YlbD family protein [Bacillus norwichensis]MBD8007019.1 YlbD family protein [Bacillus norwichensis]